MVKNDKKKILDEIDKALGEDKGQEILAFLKSNKEELLARYKEELQKQNEASEKIDDLTLVFAVKLDKVISLLEIQNGKELQKVQVVNQPIPPTEIAVTNLSEIMPPAEVSIKTPAWLGNFTTLLELNLIEPLKEFFRKQVGIFESHTNPKNPLAVRLSNGEKFIDKLTEMLGYLQQPAPVGLDKEARDLLLGIIDAIENIDIEVNIENLDVSLEDLEELNGSNLATSFNTDVTELNGGEEEIITTYTVPTGYDLLIKAIWVEGGGDGLFSLHDGEVTIWYGRNEWTRRSFTDLYEYKALEGTDVYLKVKNTTNNKINTYNGGFWGYLIKK